MADSTNTDQTTTYQNIDSDTSASIPTSQTNGSASLQSAKDSVVSGQVSNLQWPLFKRMILSNLWPTVHGPPRTCTSTLLNDIGPVAENVKDQAAKTSSEVQNVINSRKTPDTPAVTGQPLTHYHSMFYNILSWENPRASAIAFASTLILIFAMRYLPIIRWFFKISYIVLGVTALLELAGSALFNDGLTSRVRPRQYWTIPRTSLERSLDDVEQLINFFVIESQRILFAENVFVTIAVFLAAFASYWLIKIVPLWGLAVLGTCVLYLAPLVYISNRETIDHIVKSSNDIVSSQANQLKDLTAHHTGKATATVKSYAGEYTSKAQEYIGTRRSSGPYANGNGVKTEDLPSAPTTNPVKQEPTETGMVNGL